VLQQPTAHRGSAWACHFWPHENQLVTVGSDRSVQIWDAVAGQGRAGQGRAIVHGHGRRVNTVIGMARFAPGGLDPYLPEALRLPLDSIL
jgi:WD40 repeat protein